MMRIASLTAVAVLSVSALSACGGDDSKSFCEQAKAEGANAADMSADEIGKKFQDLADAAPAELKDDFNSLGDVDFSDLSNIDPSKAPDMQKAISNISDYIDKKC